MEAPGQLMKHYAPYLPCFFFNNTDLANPKFLIPNGNEKLF